MHRGAWSPHHWALLPLWCFFTVACGGAQATRRDPPSDTYERMAMVEAPPPESDEFDVLLASQNTRDCDAEHIDCYQRCFKKTPPYPYTRGASDHHRYCESKCLKEYMTCLEQSGQHVRRFSTMGRALAWLDTHKKEILIGTIVVVAGVTLVVATGGSGALALVPLTAL